MYVLTPLQSGVVVVGGPLGMVTDGVNVLSVRSRTTRSSKGKVCTISFPFSFEHHPHPSPFCLCLTPPIHLACLPTSPMISFLSSPSLLAPLGPRSKHTATHGATPSARSLRGRHNRRRKLPFPCPFRPTVWHRVSSSPASQGHMRLDSV